MSSIFLLRDSIAFSKPKTASHSILMFVVSPSISFFWEKILSLLMGIFRYSLVVLVAAVGLLNPWGMVLDSSLP